MKRGGWKEKAWEFFRPTKEKWIWFFIILLLLPFPVSTNYYNLCDETNEIGCHEGPYIKKGFLLESLLRLDFTIISKSFDLIALNALLAYIISCFILVIYNNLKQHRNRNKIWGKIWNLFIFTWRRLVITLISFACFFSIIKYLNSVCPSSACGNRYIVNQITSMSSPFLLILAIYLIYLLSFLLYILIKKNFFNFNKRKLIAFLVILILANIPYIGYFHQPVRCAMSPCPAYEKEPNILFYPSDLIYDRIWIKGPLMNILDDLVHPQEGYEEYVFKRALAVLVFSILYWYFLSCLTIFLYEKIKKKKKKRK